MDVPAESSKIFTITETKQLLAILMAPRTQTLFKDHKQHGTVWNYVYKCMKAKLPRFAKNTRQCYKKYVRFTIPFCTCCDSHVEWASQMIQTKSELISPCLLSMRLNRYENLKGKYYELKRAEMSGEQRPQWLYWKEMDYIVNQMPSNKLRTNLDHRISSLNNTSTSSTLSLSIEQGRSTTSLLELRETKPLRLSVQSQDSMGESSQHYLLLIFSCRRKFAYIGRGRKNKQINL